MDEYTKQILQEYPDYKEYLKDILVIPPEEMKELLSNKLNYKLLVTKFLRNPRYRNYLFRVFKGDFPEIRICHFVNGDLSSCITLTKINFLEQVFKLQKEKSIKFTDEDLKLISRLKKYVTYDSFIKEYKDKDIDCFIEGEHYHVLGHDIIDFIELPEATYQKLISENAPFHNIRLDYMFYIVSNFFINNDIDANYVFPEDLKKKINNITLFKDYDFESINETYKDVNSSASKTHIDQNLEAAILSGMEEDYTLLEKAIYIYLKMCNILTYNDEYYASEQLGEHLDKHRDINYLSSINLQNSEAVCYEFNAIYAYMLNKLGIHFEVFSFEESDSYGEGHENLIFRVDKYLVKADSVDSIFYGDMFNTKVGEPTTGISCVNQNEETKAEFAYALKHVYNAIKSEEEYRQKYYQKVSDLEVLQKLYGKDSPKISFNERIKMMLEYVDTSNFTGIAAYNYLLYLRKKLFTKEEQEKLLIQIVKNNLPEESTKDASSIALIFVDDNEPLYFIYEPFKPLRKVNKEELNNLFNNKELVSIYKQTEITRKL